MDANRRKGGVQHAFSNQCPEETHCGGAAPKADESGRPSRAFVANADSIRQHRRTARRIEIAMTEMNVKPIAGERSWEFGKIIRR